MIRAPSWRWAVGSGTPSNGLIVGDLRQAVSRIRAEFVAAATGIETRHARTGRRAPRQGDRAPGELERAPGRDQGHGRVGVLMDAEPGTPEGDELDVLTDLVVHHEEKSLYTMR
jgi:hypothetical protein